jgi:formylmethanofuran--tetrahydromethanopterin N-formyltransferase
MPAEIDDTYAEAFSGLYSEFLVTSKDKKWLMAAANAAVGCATSGIGCGCEAGIDRILSPKETPDGRIGAAIQFWVSCFSSEPVKQLERELLNRIGQCILTAPSSAVWNMTESKNKLAVGKKIGFFADGFQKEEKRFGRAVVNVPRMMGEFLIEKDLGYSEGVMGGNLWFFGKTESSALHAAEKAVKIISATPGVVATFPGGVCAAGSKIGSKYSFLSASTHERLCPTLVPHIMDSQVPSGVASISEVVFNGVSLPLMQDVTLKAVRAAQNTPGLVKVSAGSYGGKLGKYRIYLRKQNHKCV